MKLNFCITYVAFLLQAWAQMEIQQENNLAARKLFEVRILYYNGIHNITSINQERKMLHYESVEASLICYSYKAGCLCLSF